MKALYTKSDKYYHITLDDCLSFNLSSRMFDEQVIVDLVDKLNEGVIDLYYDGESITVEDAKRLVDEKYESSRYKFLINEYKEYDFFMSKDEELIFLKDTSKGDSRTSGGSPSLEDVLEATRTHQVDVANSMDFFANAIKTRGRIHDWTKVDNFEDEYGYLVTNNVRDEEFLKSDWWHKHLTDERHHIKDYAHLDVNLVDVLEWISDRVCAEKGRTGKINMSYLDIDPIILIRAYYNTIALLDMVTYSELED